MEANSNICVGWRTRWRRRRRRRWRWMMVVNCRQKFQGVRLVGHHWLLRQPGVWPVDISHASVITKWPPPNFRYTFATLVNWNDCVIPRWPPPRWTSPSPPTWPSPSSWSSSCFSQPSPYAAQWESSQIFAMNNTICYFILRLWLILANNTFSFQTCELVCTDEKEGIICRPQWVNIPQWDSPINEEILNRQFHNSLQCGIHMVFQLLRSTPRTTENACARSQGGHISLFLPNLKPIISPIKRQTSKSKNTFVYIASVLFLLFCVLYASMITYQSEQAKKKVQFIHTYIKK